MARRNRSGRKSPRTLARSSGKQTTHKEHLTTLLKWFLPDEGIFSHLKLHGNTTWAPGSLVWLAMFWVWCGSGNVTDRFTQAAECSERLFSSSALSTYQGFMGALVQWSSFLINLLCQRLHERMEQIGGKFWRIGLWVPIAFDGSRSTAPRTRSNEQALCAPHYGTGRKAKYGKYGTKKANSMRGAKKRKKPQPQEPQAWITMFWHMGLRLPWLWRLGPSNANEREHVTEIVTNNVFPGNTLFCGDAGFVGYPLWSAILRQGADFLVRVGGNVYLLMESADYSWQKNGLVLCWPKDMRDSGKPPLQLRLVKVTIGKASVWLLTSVLDPAKLSVAQMVRFYKLRWGVEVEFRGLKQILNCAKLRCRNEKRVLAELHWSIMAMALAELFALKEQLSRRHPKTQGPDPARRSLANTLRALRYNLCHLVEAPAPDKDLRTMLRHAVTDDYRRKASKGARYRPPNPDKKPLGDPKIRILTAEEKIRLARLRKKMAA